MRQTNVVVIPNCEELQPFSTFDKLVQSINQARRSARDFVLKKKSDDDDSKDWV
jgi:HD superfamily phosphohydrolase